MKIVCSGRQMSVRDDLRELAQKKLSALNKYFSDDVTANVTFKVRRDTEIIEVTIQMGNTLFRSEEGADTFRTALDKAVDTLERQIRRNKTRLQKRIREGAFAAPAAFPEGPDYEEEPEFSIRTKTYPIRPMSVEEAILQMNLLEHQFFVFVDDVDQETRVVYRRKDGGYGLIIPE
ncbi:MAG: ribosome-associated translation inhibitor RaiA [Clostridia bacterium]|nr:ribosome-associated translation inhibitor RaiA [Clostridia bacterium]